MRGPVQAGRRAALLSVGTWLSIVPVGHLPAPALAALVGDTDAVSQQFDAGARSSGGRGANALLKKRAESGVLRIGNADPMFKSGSILDCVRAEDGSAVDISFVYPSAWTVSKGPNLDVRDVRTSDSAFLLVAPVPKAKTISSLPKSFFTSLLFSQEGKYGACT